MNCVDCDQEMNQESYLTVEIGEFQGEPLIEADVQGRLRLPVHENIVFVVPMCTTCIAIRAYTMAQEKQVNKRHGKSDRSTTNL